MLFSSYKLIPLFFFSFLIKAQSGIDHAPTTNEYVTIARDFVDKHFKEDEEYSVEKISQFQERLEEELLHLRQDVVETTRIEAIEVEVKNPKKVKDKSDRRKAEDDEIILGYTEYLLPKIKELLIQVRIGADQSVLDGLADDFVRGYNPYFVPNAHRSIWPFDVDALFAIKKFLRPYSYKRENKKYIEANNLMVQSENLAEIRQCLGSDIKVGHYLSLSDLQGLAKCFYDISKLSPGISALWKNKTLEEKSSIHSPNPDWFPKDEEKVYFKKVNYRGAGSPKFKVYFEREGKKIELKLKTGIEVHTEIIVSRLAELVGLNQDRMLYKDKVRLYLGDTTYEEFKSVLVNKYGMQSARRFIWAYDDKCAEPWVELNDVIYEARPEEEKRVSLMDFTSWDLQNRREFRSLILFWGWLGLNDTKLENFKFLLKKEADGRIVPLFRFQDTGIALGGELNFRKVDNILSFTKYYKINAFPHSFLKNEKDSVGIFWNDFANRKNMFSTTTYNDLKWMARQIAKISQEDIFKILIDAGVPDEVRQVLYIKLLNRRNEVVSSFGLVEEFPLFSVPTLKKFSPEKGKAIHKGEIVQTAFSGKNDVVQLQHTWSVLIPSVLKYPIEMINWDPGNSEMHAVGGVGGVRAESFAEANFKRIPRTGSILTLPIGVGIQVIISRRVDDNHELINLGDRNNLFLVVDSIKFRFGASSPAFEKFMKGSPFGASAHIKFIEKEFEHIHHAETASKGYKSSFQLLKIIANPKKFAAFELKPLELINSFTSYGIDVGASGYLKTVKPFVNIETEFQLKTVKLLSRYYVRDEFGKLHVYSNMSRDNLQKINFTPFEIELFEATLPFLKLSYTHRNFKTKLSDYIIDLSNIAPTREGIDTYLTHELREKEYQVLKNFDEIVEQEDDVQYPFFHKNFSLSSHGLAWRWDAGVFFVYGKSYAHARADTKVELSDGSERFFYRYATDHSSALGVEKLRLDFGQSDVLVSGRKKISIVSEVDLDVPKKYVTIARIEDFYRKISGEKLLQVIGDLNRRYSKSTEEPFYAQKIPEEALDTYFRKIYGLTRVYIKGHKLYEALIKKSISEITSIARKHFDFNKEKSEFEAGHMTKKTRFNRFKGKLKKLKSIPESADHRKIIKAAHELISALCIEDHGLYFLKNVLAPEDLFVMGEIAGVLRNYSTQQGYQQIQKRRFTGQSWGEYTKAPPLQRFLRYHRLIPPSMYIVKHFSDQDIFGKLEVGTERNIQVTFDGNVQF